MMSSKKLRDFYNQFFNNKYFRDIDYIRGKWGSFKDAEPKDSTDRLRYGVKNLTNDVNDMTKFRKSARYFLMKKQHKDGQGQLVHHNSYFKNPSDFHSLQTADRLYDRLFYDIDKHNDVIDGFKHEIADIKARQIGSDVGYTYKQKLRDIKQVQKKYRNYILTTDFLDDPYSDCLKVQKYYNDRGTEPVLIFTGGAGFHINVFFKPVHLNYPKEMSLSYLNLIGEKCDIPIDDPQDKGISNLDPAVTKNAVNGNQRTPYSVHDKSGLTGFIIPADTSYDDLLTMIKKNRPDIPDFNYDNHLVPDVLNDQIVKMDTLAGQKKQEKIEQSRQKRSRLTGNVKHIYLDGKYIGYGVHEPDGNGLSDDLRVLWDLMVLDGAVEPPKDKDIRKHYNRVRCSFPDHEDRTPSAIVGKYRYKCFKCCPDGINWYMLIAVTYGIISPDDINKEIPQDKKPEINKVIKRLQGISPDE